MDQDLVEESPQKRVRGDPPPPDHPAGNDDQTNDLDVESDVARQIQNFGTLAGIEVNLTNILLERNAVPGLFKSHFHYHESCALVGCTLPREKTFADNKRYCCRGHKKLSSKWSEKKAAFHVYGGLNENKVQRDELCCTTVKLKADGIDVGIPTLETSSVFTKPPWENEDLFPTALRDHEGSRDYLFFATPPPFYITFGYDKALPIKWKPNPRLKRQINGQEVAITGLTINVPLDAEGQKRYAWKLYLYQYRDLSLYCLSLVVQGALRLKLPPKTPKQKRPKPDEDPNGGEEKGKEIREVSTHVIPNSNTGKTKPPTTRRQGRGKDIVASGNTMSKCCSVFDDFGLEKVRQVYFADVCGSTLDSHHGFVAECGPSRDVDLGEPLSLTLLMFSGHHSLENTRVNSPMESAGFHVDDSEVTLNVSLGKQSVGGELYFQGASYNNIGKRYDAKSEVAVFAPSRSSPYVTITLKTMFEPLYRELYTFDPTFFFTPSFLKAINGDTVESFGSVVSVSSPGIFVSEMLQPKFYEMMLSKVDKFGEWVNVAKIQITKPNTMRKYGTLLDNFGLDSMLENIMEVFPEVCGLKSDSQNGFVVEYGTDRDIDLGFHVDDSELTSNVSLSKHFEGEELYFRGTRCKKHDVNTDTKPEEMFGDSHTPDQAVLRHGDRATTSGHGVDMILWSRRDAIISEGILKLMRSKLLRKEIKAKPDSCCQKK
ncbi:unnamed protein product, partial [Arabidopsis halleri]